VLIRGAEIAGTGPLDVRIEGDRITEITPALPRVDGELTLDADGGALLPGLHDHHIHLFALAAAEQSVRCGPPEVCNVDALARALEHANVRDEWIRGVGYHESVAGELDRTQLDAWLADRPLRIQHRSGALWLLNSAGVERLGLDRGADAHGIERDARGRATGRLYRLDDWLRERLEAKDPPNLDAVSRRLADRGVTGLTDATATNDTEALSALVAAVDSGALRQRIPRNRAWRRQAIARRTRAAGLRGFRGGDRDGSSLGSKRRDPLRHAYRAGARVRGIRGRGPAGG